MVPGQEGVNPPFLQREVGDDRPSPTALHPERGSLWQASCPCTDGPLVKHNNIPRARGAAHPPLTTDGHPRLNQGLGLACQSLSLLLRGWTPGHVLLDWRAKGGRLQPAAWTVLSGSWEPSSAGERWEGLGEGRHAGVREGDLPDLGPCPRWPPPRSRGCRAPWAQGSSAQVSGSRKPPLLCFFVSQHLIPTLRPHSLNTLKDGVTSGGLGPLCVVFLAGVKRRGRWQTDGQAP